MLEVVTKEKVRCYLSAHLWASAAEIVVQCIWLSEGLTEIAPEQLHNEPGWGRGWMLGQDILLSGQG